MSTTPYDDADYVYLYNRSNLFSKTEKYYKEIIELAQNYEIPVMVVISPYIGMGYSDQCKFNTGADIANKMNVPFINYNFWADEMDLNYSDDFADKNHLNYKGNQKYTHLLGEYI